QQTRTVTRVESGKSRVVGRGLLTTPDNIGPRSTPNYHALAAAQVHQLDDGSTVFAGQRDDGFFGDVGAVFDLVAIRAGTGASGGGKDFFAGYAVHTAALQVPLSELDNGGNHVVGVWSATDRPVVTATLATTHGRTVVKDTRLNLGIAPTAAVGNGNRLGVLGGDLAGYPNGRRLEDDVIDISERAVGGALIGHSLPLGDGVDANDVAYMTTFPYEANPFSGFDNTKGQLFPTHP